MRSLLALLAVLTAGAPWLSAARDPGATGPRVPWDGSRLAGSPEPPAAYAVGRVFPQLPIRKPVALAWEPGTRRLFLLENHRREERRSLLKCFEARPDVTTADVLLDGRESLYSLTFHPRYPENGWIYVGSNGPGTGGQPHSRIVRHTVDRRAPYRLVAGSALTVIEWPSNGHDGAAAVFGRDGMLYVTSGDGTGLSDRDQVGQDLSSLRAKVLRLDVDGAEPGRGYRVPADNPFTGQAGIRPETWAYGLRNPWRICADPEGSQIWVGNNGQDLRESAYLLERGANYGWSAYEGSRPFVASRLRGPAPFTPPTIEHPHSVFRSLTGGVVYRGSQWPELQGAYVYGDYGTGRIWAAFHDGARLQWNRELVDTPFAITGFAATPEGDILVADHGGDAIHRLERAPPPKPRPTFPANLSQTGLFASTRNLRSAPGVHPYEINAPAWHDGAQAAHLLALPGSTRAKPNGPWRTWDLPDGTALVQTLTLPAAEGGPGRRVETRLLLRQEGDWSAYSYVWNDEQTDARLAPAEGERLVLGSRAWLVPSRSDCLGCHSREANFALGLTSAQLNRDVAGDGGPRNQLALFTRLGLISEPGRARPGQRLVNPYDETAPLADRARAYLAVNCAHCHVPNGGGNSELDFRAGPANDRRPRLDAVPLHGDFGLPDARVVAPGQPGRSVLPLRVALRGTGQMPPLGTLAADPDGVRLLHAWIFSLAASPP